MTNLRPLSSSPTAASPPVEFDADGTDERLVRVGVSLHGWVYRAATGTALYRVLSYDALSNEAGLQWRGAVRDRAEEGNERHGTDGVLFPIHTIPGADYFLIRYDPKEPVFPLSALLEGVPRPQGMMAERVFRATADWWRERGGEPQFAGLAAALGNDSPALRVMAVGWVIQAVAEWRRHGIPLLQMPADVVFDQNGRPFFLWLPFLRLPDAEQLLAEPERILYLPPELMGARGATAWGNDSWYRADWYAFGVMLLQSFYRLASPRASEAALARAANGTLFDAARRSGTAPGWLTRAPATQDALNRAGKLTDPDPARRALADPVALGHAIEGFGLRLTPSAAIEDLVNADPARGAIQGLDLVRSLLLAGETYDHLLLAGRLAASVQRSLDALDFLGRAITLDPARPDARVLRMGLIASASDYPALAELVAREGPRLDVLMWEDFNALDADGQRDQQLALARYLVWREQYDSVAPYVYRWLFSENGEYRWLYLPMNLVYADILLAQARRAVDTNQPTAGTLVWGLRAHLDVCKEAIKELRRSGALEPGEIYTHGTHLSGIDIACLEMERRVPRPPPPPAPAPVAEAPAAAPAAEVPTTESPTADAAPPTNPPQEGGS